MSEVSVFDVIGPIMVGPSSSHTAGAVRLGLMARALLGHPPHKAIIGIHGSFAHTGRGHGTDRALVAGLLGFAPDDDRIRASFSIAQAQGLAFTLNPVDLGSDAHPNSATINAVTSWFLHYHLNIATFKVSRHQRGGQAIMIIASDDDLPHDLPDAITDFPWVTWARYIPKLAS